MNIIPRRRRNPDQTGFEFDDLWKRLLPFDEEGLVNHLPEVFRQRPVPAINIAETEDSYVITMDCPGLDEEDFRIEAMGGQLLISGERKWETEKEGKEFRRVESQYGKFERTVQLPDNARLEAESISAGYRKGVLTITVGKLEKTPATRIPVRAE